MTTEDGLGKLIRSGLRLEEPPKVLIKNIGKMELSVVEGVKRSPDKILSGSLQMEDSYIVNVPLSDYLGCENWENGRYAATRDLRAGSTIVADLKRDPRFVIDRSFHTVHFHVPRSALDAAADGSDAPRIGELIYRVGVGYDDPVVRHLMSAMRPALAQPEQANGMFVEYMVLALAAHLARTYGNLQASGRPSKGGLAGWQERRALEIIAANLSGDVSLHDLAAECRLSMGHFSRAFRQSTGMPPHRWLLHRRIEAATEMMNGTRLSLADIAAATGFADQSHFTQVFKRQKGATPGTWRREHATGPVRHDD